MSNVSNQIFRLEMAIKRALKDSSINLNLKEKLLLCIYDKPLPPLDAMEYLTINRPNLTHLCNSLIEDGLIEKKKDSSDLRQIKYHITNKGKDEIDSISLMLESRIKQLFKSNEEYGKLNECIEEIIKALAFI